MSYYKSHKIYTIRKLDGTTVTERDWSDIADEMWLSDNARLDFLEEVAGWL